MDMYIESGYTESGYIEGDIGFSIGQAGKVPLKFFFSTGSMAQADLLKSVQGQLQENEISLIYMPEASKFLLGNKKGFMEFTGNAINMKAILNNKSFTKKVRDDVKNVIKNDLQPNINVSIVASNGSVVAGATAVQTEYNTFEITVPENLVAQEYKLVFTELFKA